MDAKHFLPGGHIVVNEAGEVVILRADKTHSYVLRDELKPVLAACCHALSLPVPGWQAVTATEPPVGWAGAGAYPDGDIVVVRRDDFDQWDGRWDIQFHPPTHFYNLPPPPTAKDADNAN